MRAKSSGFSTRLRQASVTEIPWFIALIVTGTDQPVSGRL
jgi:hypothetical protein